MPLASPALRDKYIDDLIRARPQGPIGNKVTYTVEHKWCNRSDRYRGIPIPSDPMWGYSPEQIFSLGLYSRDDVEAYALKRWWKGTSKWSLGRQKATFTRRINRLWEQRLEDMVHKIQSSGGDGIYRVGLGRRYYSSQQEVGHIYASNQDEAKRFAEMFFSYLCEGDVKVQVSFVRFGKPEEVIILNTNTVNNAAAKIKSMEEKIESLKASIKKQNMYLETLNMVQNQQLSIES